METREDFFGVPVEFVLRLTESFLFATKYIDHPTNLHENIFFGVPMRLLVNTHWKQFERFMIVGRDWQSGFNLAMPAEGEPSYPIFGTSMSVSNASVNGRDAFLRDMTVLRMSYSEWRLDHHPETLSEAFAFD